MQARIGEDQQRGDDLGPDAELLGGYTRTVIGGVSKNAEDAGGKEVSDRHCHPGELLHEKGDLVLAIKFKGRADSFSCIGPWVIVIQPRPKAVQRGLM